jgi:Tfp pilus assembly protein PilN
MVSLDRSFVTLRIVKLPSTNEEEIKSMAEWQAAKLLPYKIDEIVVSHQLIKSSEGGFSYVLLIIIPRNIIKKFTDVCDILKLQPKAITFTSEGLANWYIELQSDINTENNFALVDIEKDNIEVAIFQERKFAFGRSFSLSNIQGENEINNKIIEEVKLSVESYYKQEACQSIKKIILTGEKKIVSNLPQIFRNSFDLPVEIVEHTRNLILEKNIIETISSQNVSLASIAGLALSSKPSQINLLPPEIKAKNLFLQKRKELHKTVYLAISAVLAFCVIFSYNFYHKKVIIANLDKQLEKINPSAKEIQNIKNKIKIVNAQMSNENSCLEILREIHRISPKDIYLNTFIFQEADEVILKGTAPSMSLVFSFVPILNDSLFFENVQVRYATQRKMQALELTDFEIICKLSTGTDKK